MGVQFDGLRAANLPKRYPKLSPMGPHSRMVHGYDLIGMYTNHVCLHVPTFRGDDVLPSELKNDDVKWNWKKSVGNGGGYWGGRDGVELLF